MEIRVILRGALSGFMAGVLGFVFARIFAEPVINQAIDYESGRDAALAADRDAARQKAVLGKLTKHDVERHVMTADDHDVRHARGAQVV